MVETMVRRSSSTQLRPARFAATPTASPQGPAPTTRRSTCSNSMLHLASRSICLDDLIPPRTHAHVTDRHGRELLQPVEIRPSLLREVLQPPGATRRPVPTSQHLVPRLHSAQRLDLGRHLVTGLVVQSVRGADRDLLEPVEY